MNGRLRELDDGDFGEPDGLAGSASGPGGFAVSNEAPDDPFRLARAVLAKYDHLDGSMLAWYRGDFHLWSDGAFRVDPDFEAVELTLAIKRELDSQASGPVRRDDGVEPARNPLGHRPRFTTPKVTSGLVRDVRKALAALAVVGRGRVSEAPFWVVPREGDPDPAVVLPLANGLLCLEDGGPRRIDHTPRFFCLATARYDYDPEAAEPEHWLKLLNDQWAGDPESVRCLHEHLGYLLTPDTRYHKMLLWIGPKRSERGTIRDVMENLVGRENVAATSVSGLGETFGLEPLLGKTVAVMADARTGDASPLAVDRLLRISGRDPVDVNRKHKPCLSSQSLLVRFLLLSNEIPNIRDSANAVTERYNILRATRTIPDKDRDPDLGAKLLKELPGVLNLAIAGLYRLRARGRFVQAESALQLLEDAKAIASPIGTFVSECLAAHSDESIPKAEAFQMWTEWAKTNGYPPGNIAMFGKNLKAAFPDVKDGPRRRVGVCGDQIATYAGVGRKPPASLTDPWHASAPPVNGPAGAAGRADVSENSRSERGKPRTSGEERGTGS